MESHPRSLSLFPLLIPLRGSRLAGKNSAIEITEERSAEKKNPKRIIIIIGIELVEF